MAHDVFVSYSSKDKTVADAVCATLERRGIRCWIAPRDILPGLDWGAAIVDAIGSSRVMVLVFSGNANKSPQIKREVERAVSKGVTIVPFRIEDVPLGKTFEYFISTAHWFDAFPPPIESHLERLADTAQALLSRRPSSTGAAIPRPPLDTRSQATPASPAAPTSAASLPANWQTGPAPYPRGAQGASPRAIAAIGVVALVVGGGAFFATRGHSPQIVSIQFPSSIPAGQRGNGVLQFRDKKGDASLVRFDVLQGSSFKPWTMELPGVAGRDSGSYAFWLSSPVAEHVVLQATVIDNEGRKSSPVSFSFDVLPPNRSPRKKGFEIQAPNGFRFKVN
jgi:TIR domain